MSAAPAAAAVTAAAAIAVVGEGEGPEGDTAVEAEEVGETGLIDFYTQFIHGAMDKVSE